MVKSRAGKNLRFLNLFRFLDFLGLFRFLGFNVRTVARGWLTLDTGIREEGLYTKVNLQATKLFIVTSATKGVVTTPFRFSVRFRILYRAIQRLIQHCLLRKMVYLNIIYVIATRNYEFCTTGIVS